MQRSDGRQSCRISPSTVALPAIWRRRHPRHTPYGDGDRRYYVVDPTDERPTHPLTERHTSRQVPADRQTDTSKVTIINRPRFSPIEALILNLLVSRHPEIVPLGEVRRYIAPMCYVMPTDTSVAQHIVKLRAKIGEQLRNPKQIVSIRRVYKNRYGDERLHLIGYRWVEPGETFVDEGEVPDA